MNLDNLDKYFDFLFDRAVEWINYRAWQVENWWQISQYGPPTFWYNLQNYFDPLPPDGSGGPDLNLVSFALTYMTRKQSRRYGWYNYHCYKWLTRPESIIYTMAEAKTKKAKKLIYMATELQKVALENFIALLAEIEIRRVHTQEEVIRAYHDPVVKARLRETYDAYIDSL